MQRVAEDFCSWYLEWVKPPYGETIDAEILGDTLHYFEELVLLLHPFMPFVTEEIYHQLRDRQEGDDLAIRQSGSQAGKEKKSAAPISLKLLERGKMLKEVITGIRDARNKNNIKPKDPITLHIQTADKGHFELIEPILAKQVNAATILFTGEAVPQTIAVVVGKERLYIQAETALDTTGQKDQLVKDLVYLKGFLETVEKKLGNERFVQNAKPEVVEVERKKKKDAEERIKAIEESLAAIENG